MRELFIPYEQALALKELGFDESCLGWYESEHFVLSVGESWRSSGNSIATPLYAQAFQWFLDKYGLFVETTLWGDGIGFMSQIKQIKQEEFKEVYNLGLVTPNRGLPNWNKQLEDLTCLKKLIEIAQKE